MFSSFEMRLNVEKIYGWPPISYYFTVRPFVQQKHWTDGGAMRKPSSVY